MAKSKGIGRGGKRLGAGRKPKQLISEAKRPEVIDAAKARIEKIAAASDGPASALVSEAYVALQDVMNNSPFPAPRVAAARAIIDLAKEERIAAGAGVVPGKKADAKSRAVDRAVGKFAAPAPPGPTDRLQ